MRLVTQSSAAGVRYGVTAFVRYLELELLQERVRRGRHNERARRRCLLKLLRLLLLLLCGQLLRDPRRRHRREADRVAEAQRAERRREHRRGRRERPERLSAELRVLQLTRPTHRLRLRLLWL